LLIKTARRIEASLIEFVNILKDRDKLIETNGLNNNAKELLSDITSSMFINLIRKNSDFQVLKNDFKINSSNENNTIETIVEDSNKINKKEKRKICLPYRVILEDGNTRVNKNNRSCEKIQYESPGFFSLSPNRISIIEEQKIQKRGDFKEVFKKYKINSNRMNVRENLKATDRLVKNYEVNIKSPRVKSQMSKNPQSNIPKNVLKETNSNLYIKINRNNLGPKLDLRNKKPEKIGTPSFYNNIFSRRGNK
jgi:hypothetical protein